MMPSAGLFLKKLHKNFSMTGIPACKALHLLKPGFQAMSI